MTAVCHWPEHVSYVTVRFRSITTEAKSLHESGTLNLKGYPFPNFVDFRTASDARSATETINEKHRFTEVRNNKVMKLPRKAVSHLAAGLASAAAIGASTASLHAGGTDVWFVPLTESAPVVAPNDLEELYAPWTTPDDISQVNLMSLREVEDGILSPMQSVIRVPAGTSSSMFDMIAYDDTGEFLFIPHETPFGAGVSRHDIAARSTQVLFQGDSMGASGDWSNDFGAFDPCRFTPNETLFLAEEWAGEGRVIEVMNPFDAPEDIVIRELESIANVSHEGINFSEQDDRVIYYIDEWNSGSIYKFVMSRPGDYTSGQTFVLKVDAFNGNPADLWNDPSNINEPRTGTATWVPLTNWLGIPLPGISDPFRNGPTDDPRTNPDTLGGRGAADDAGGTPYGRPEDMEVARLRNGREVLYICMTSENAVYSVEILNSRRARVGILTSGDTPTNVGYAPTTGTLGSPDNLAQDALGNIYVIEDAPNSSDTGGDIWFVRDANNDGVAESLDHFMSIRADGCEATGMIFNPVNPTEFVVAVQHPDSTDLAVVPNGLGDAIWKFDLSSIRNQTFVEQLRRGPERGNGKRGWPHRWPWFASGNR